MNRNKIFREKIVTRIRNKQKSNKINSKNAYFLNEKLTQAKKRIIY